ncbi:MAG: VPLPA-CTERM sorting domain-containing protein [Pseudomonadota bacterium]
MKHVFIGFGAALGLALPVNAATIVAYDIGMNGAFITPSEEAEGVSGAVLARSGGLVPSGASTGLGLFRSKGWTNYGDAAAARAGYNSLTWGFSSSIAYDLTSLDIRYDGSNKGPQSITIDAIVNGGTPVFDIFTDHDINTAGETNLGIDLSMFTEVTSIQFILSGWGATKDKGTFALHNTFDGPALRINGVGAAPAVLYAANADVAIVPTPLPAGLPLLAAGLGALAVLRRRR